MTTHSSILAGKSHGQRSLAGYSPWGRQESDTTEHTHTDIDTHVTLKNLFFFLVSAPRVLGFPHSSVGKESVCNAGEPASIPGSGRSPGEGNGNPLQYSCLEIPMGRGTWWATVHGVTRVGHDLATKPPNHHHPEHPVLPLYQIVVAANVFSKIRVMTHQ